MRRGLESEVAVTERHVARFHIIAVAFTGHRLAAHVGCQGIAHEAEVYELTVGHHAVIAERDHLHVEVAILIELIVGGVLTDFKLIVGRNLTDHPLISEEAVDRHVFFREKFGVTLVVGAGGCCDHESCGNRDCYISD